VDNIETKHFRTYVRIYDCDVQILSVKTE
jgi:hypothetical protein